MSYTTAFLQNGETREITAADTPPEAVQIPANFTVGARQRNQFRVVNSSDENIAFLGAGPTAAIAATNAAVVSTTGNSIPLLPGSVEILSFPPDWYFTLSTVSSTAVVYITPGEGL